MNNPQIVSRIQNVNMPDWVQPPQEKGRYLIVEIEEGGTTRMWTDGFEADEVLEFLRDAIKVVDATNEPWSDEDGHQTVKAPVDL